MEAQWKEGGEGKREGKQHGDPDRYLSAEERKELVERGIL